MSVIVHPSRANLIRAYVIEHPGLSPVQIAKQLGPKLIGLKAPEVRKAVGSGDKRRIKSVAP
jgi:hypothetical protein